MIMGVNLESNRLTSCLFLEMNEILELENLKGHSTGRRPSVSRRVSLLMSPGSWLSIGE